MSDLNEFASYHSVRGQLTRNLLQKKKIKCPDRYGDPALLTPLVYQPNLPKKYEVGVVLRWSETEWLKSKSIDDNVLIIDLGTPDVENTLNQILSCKRIVTSSLHGLIIADAYNIPNAWLESTSPKGGEFRFYDYFLSVDKVRRPQSIEISDKNLKVETLLNKLQFDDRKIKFDHRSLLDSCPFLDRR